MRSSSRQPTAWSSTTTVQRTNSSPPESCKSTLQSISKELEQLIRLSRNGSQHDAISRCIRRLGSLSLPVKHVPLTKEIVTVIRWLILAINNSVPEVFTDEDFTRIATFVTHAVAQDQLILRGLTVVPTTSPSMDNENLSMETDDGVFAGVFVFLLNHLHRIMDSWNTPQGSSQDGPDNSNLVVQNPPEVAAAAATVSAVVACLHCLILMVERSCAFSSKQPSLTPADPASVPPGI